MKPIALFAFFFFLLFVFTTTAKFVHNSDGDLVVSGGKYYFSPLDSVGGGVFFMLVLGGEQLLYCNLAVIQYWDSAAREITIEARFAFYVQTASFKHIVALSTTQHMHQHTKWLVIDSEPLGQAVMVGDAKEFSEPVVNGWFQIKSYDNKYYKLVFCTKSDYCGNIGTKVDKQGYSRLVVTDKKPLLFKFNKIQ